jgi:phosphoribosylformimino-5-aminoimidazole carboxamide ribotide isomerase
VNLYPAIDLLDGRIVRAERGKREAVTVYDIAPVDAVRRFAAAGVRWLHVVDLNRAFGDPVSNVEHVRQITTEASRHGMRVQGGGGLREPADVADMFLSSVARVVLGTVAAVSPELVAPLLERYGGRLAVAIDARGGEVVVRGRSESTGRSASDFAGELARMGVRRFLFTDVGRVGTFTGADVEGAARLAQDTGLPVIASGGVGGIEHVRAAVAAGVDGLVVGRALYEGRLDLAEAVAVAGVQVAT